MSDVITQKCAGCGALRPSATDATAAKWTRVFGVSAGGAQQPVRIVQARVIPQLNNQALDFCGACAAKTTVDKLAAFYLVKKT